MEVYSSKSFSSIFVDLKSPQNGAYLKRRLFEILNFGKNYTDNWVPKLGKTVENGYCYLSYTHVRRVYEYAHRDDDTTTHIVREKEHIICVKYPSVLDDRWAERRRKCRYIIWL